MCTGAYSFELGGQHIAFPPGLFFGLQCGYPDRGTRRCWSLCLVSNMGAQGYENQLFSDSASDHSRFCHLSESLSMISGAGWRPCYSCKRRCHD